MTDGADLERFQSLIQQTYLGNAEEINDANSQLRDLYSSDTFYCLRLAAETILKNFDKERIIMLSLSFIKTATSRTRFSMQIIKSQWLSEEFLPIRNLIKDAIIQSINNPSQIVRNISAAVLAQILLFEDSQWNDIFARILDVATDDRGTAGRLSVIYIFQEILNLHYNIETENLIGFFNLVAVSLKQDSEAAIPGLKVLTSLVKENPSFFLIDTSERVDVLLNIIDHFLQSTVNDEVMNASLLMTQILKDLDAQIPYFMDKILSNIFNLINNPNDFMAKCGSYVIYEYRWDNDSMRMSALKNYVQFVPELLSALRRPIVEPNRLIRDDDVESFISYSIMAFWDADYESTLNYIIDFFHECVAEKEDNWSAKYAAVLAILSTCSYEVRPILAYVQPYYDLITEVFDWMKIDGPELLVYSILGLIYRLIPVLDKEFISTRTMQIFTMLTNSLQLQNKHIDDIAFKVFIKLIEKLQYEPIRANYGDFYNIVTIYIETPVARVSNSFWTFVENMMFYTSSPDILNEHLTKTMENVQKYLENGPLEENTPITVLGSLHVMDTIIKSLKDDDTQFRSTDNDEKERYADFKNTVQNIYIRQIIVLLLRGARNADIQIESFEVLGHILSTYNEDVLREYMPSFVELARQLLMENDPQAMKVSAKFYAKFFEKFGENAIDFVGEEFDWMLTQITNAGEDPLGIIPEFTSSVGRILCKVKTRIDQSKLQNFFSVIEDLTEIYVNKDSKLEYEYAVSLYCGLISGIRGIVLAIDDETGWSKEFIMSIKLLIKKLLKAILAADIMELDILTQFIDEKDGLVVAILDRFKPKYNVFWMWKPFYNVYLDKALNKFNVYQYDKIRKQIPQIRMRILA